MMIDLAPLVQVLAMLALAALTAVTPYLAPAIRRYLHIQVTASQAAAIQSAADAGAKAAYGYVAINAGNFRDFTIRDAAIAKVCSTSLPPHRTPWRHSASRPITSARWSRLASAVSSQPTRT